MNKVIKFVWLKMAIPKWVCWLKLWVMKIRGAEVEFLLNDKEAVRSSLEVDIVIPVIEKDLEILPWVVESIRKNIKHPIINIFIVSPVTEKIQNTVKELGCTLVDEIDVLGFSKKEIDYIVNGMDRSGWLFQQLLKLGMVNICKSKNYLVMDADTAIAKPTVFEDEGKIIFDCSDERHRAYYEMYEKLLGKKVVSPVSFVAHHMLFNKSILKDLKKRLEKRYGTVWYKAIIDNIDKGEISCFSEFETYGNYFLDRYPKKIKIRYWHNYEVSPKIYQKNEIGDIIKKYSRKHRTLSFHWYDR